MSSVCNFITEINEQNCIGQSLNTINNNFINSRNFICVVDNQLDVVQQRLETLTTIVCGISAEQLDKAWILFNGHIDSTGFVDGGVSPTRPARQILNKYNVLSANKNGVGDYTIIFPMSLLTATIFDIATPAISTATNIVSSISATVLQQITAITIDTLPLTSINYGQSAVDITYTYNVFTTPTQTRQTVAKSLSGLVITGMITPSYNYNNMTDIGVITYSPDNPFPNLSSLRLVTSNLTGGRFDPELISLNFFN